MVQTKKGGALTQSVTRLFRTLQCRKRFGMQTHRDSPPSLAIGGKEGPLQQSIVASLQTSSRSLSNGQLKELYFQR